LVKASIRKQEEMKQKSENWKAWKNPNSSNRAMISGIYDRDNAIINSYRLHMPGIRIL